jgi:integral membrane protein, TerC family
LFFLAPLVPYSAPEKGLVAVESILPWLGFNLFVLVMLGLDLGVLHRKSGEMTFREAMLWSAFWIGLAGIFNLGLWYFRGPEDALAFLTGFLIEKSLSIDNLFVFLLIFSALGVPPAYQRKVLFWGILGALVFRAIFIFAGVALITKFHWMMYVFGGLLVVTGLRLVFEKEKEVHPETNPILRVFRRFLPITPTFQGDRFLVRNAAGRLFATPLLAALVMVEASDIVFAVDSIPAILAVTQDPFLVYTANVFAILGLRSLYFALAGTMQKFHHLHYGLAVILLFVGTKLLLVDVYKMPTAVSLGVIATALVGSILASLKWPKPEEIENLPTAEGAGAP